jgi:hypothetical protein
VVVSTAPLSTRAPDAARVTTATYAGVFCVTLSTLMLEIALTRIFSVTMWYHFAFVAISVALFGLTFGALTVHLQPQRFPEAAVKRRMWQFSLMFGISIPICLIVQLAIPFTPRLTVGGIASVVATCAVISVPFVLAGIVVCLALTRFPERTNRLYAVDLVGAGLGCVLLVALFSWFDGPSLVMLVGSIACIGALAFAADGRDRRAAAIAGIAVVLIAGFALVNTLLHQDGNAIVHVMWAKEARDPQHDYERWNAFSRLTVDGDAEDPDTKTLSLVIDSTAGTALNRFSGDPAESDFLRAAIQNLVHYIRQPADVAVIGVGGGTDVLSALEFDQRSVTGIEINGDIVDIVNGRYGAFTGHLDRDPRVHIVNDEARSYFTRTDRQFDIIQVSLIDTWAATSSGAFALSENGLYTTQAWNTYLDRLEPAGVLSVTRFYQTTDPKGKAVQPLETYRTVGLAAKVLTERGGKDPREHILVYRVPTGYGVDLATVIVSPEPISASDRSILADRAAEFGFTPVLTADAVEDPVLARLTAPGGPDRAVSSLAADISPPTDNRPFFFQMADLGTFLDRGIWRDDYVTRPVLVLAMLAVTVLALAAACVVFPLLLGRRRGQVIHRRSLPFFTYFAGIGLGFLLIEVSLLQRLSIFLGHPTYGLTVVLFSMLVFSGIGSMCTERVVRSERRRSLLAPLVVLLGIVTIHGFVAPRILEATDGATTPVRIATAVAILAPLAFMLGMPFSIGMRVAAGAPETPTAFLWAVNGAASVCASVLGVVIALFFGISAAFWAGALAYVLACASMAFITRAPRPTPASRRRTGSTSPTGGTSDPRVSVPAG